MLVVSKDSIVEHTKLIHIDASFEYMLRSIEEHVVDDAQMEIRTFETSDLDVGQEDAVPVDDAVAVSQMATAERNEMLWLGAKRINLFEATVLPIYIAVVSIPFLSYFLESVRISFCHATAIVCVL